EAAGLDLCPIGRLEHHRAFMDDEALFDWRAGIARTTQGLMRHFLPTVGPCCEAIIDLYDPGRTVLISTGAWLLREKCDVPCVVALTSPSRMPNQLDPPHPPRPLPRWARLLTGRPSGLRLLWGLRAARNAITSKSAQTGVDHATRVRRTIAGEFNRVRARYGLSPIGRDSVRPPIAV